LLTWYGKQRRDLPWRKSTDFYPVWVSETMLQQTRVEAVIPYYQRFLSRFPSVEALAGAAESEVLALWSGLGYYSRARNLHKAAKQVAAEGVPASHEELCRLPGVGPYTAAALASIALGQAHAALDGNVLRVMSRLLAEPGETAARVTQRRIGEKAEELLDPKRPGDFNQAMMELGATVCVPGKPACDLCPVARFCAARAAGRERELPVKRRRAETRERAMELVVLEHEGTILLVQRGASAKRLAGFWELPEKQQVKGVRGRAKAAFTHAIVNDRYRVKIWRGKTQHAPEGRWIPLAELGGVPVSTITRKALQATGIPFLPREI
jgi:A/G-specific adenine glycosylase